MVIAFLLRQRPDRAKWKYSSDRNQSEYCSDCNHCLEHGTWSQAYPRVWQHHCYDGLLPYLCIQQSAPHCPVAQSSGHVWPRKKRALCFWGT